MHGLRISRYQSDGSTIASLSTRISGGLYEWITETSGRRLAVRRKPLCAQFLGRLT